MGTTCTSVSALKTRLDEARSEFGSLTKCPVRDVVDIISGRWSSLLMLALSEQPHRFGALRRLIPDISQRMLTQTLHELQRDGYVHRQVFATKPPGVEYSLTELGHSMFAALNVLIEWADENHASVRAARLSFDSEKESA